MNAVAYYREFDGRRVAGAPDRRGAAAKDLAAPRRG